MSKCYLCGAELTKENKSEEHIINNALGGRLKSYDLLCRTCNNKMGDKSDDTLAEDLKFFIEMFQIQRERNKELKGILMTDEYGHLIQVKEGGNKLKLHEVKASIEVHGDGSKTFHGLFRNLNELKNALEKSMQRGRLTKDEVDQIIKNAVPTNERKRLKGKITIRKESFPSIIKMLVNFYMFKTLDSSLGINLKPYILNQKDCQDLMTIMVFEEFRLAPNFNSLHHTLKIRGKKGEGLVGIIEFFNVYSYGVILDKNYCGEDLDFSYCFDVLNLKEVGNYNPNIDLSVESVKKMKNIFHTTPQIAWNEMKIRMEQVLKLKSDLDRKKISDKIINEAFESLPEGAVITEEFINKLADRLVDELILPYLQ